MRDRILVLLQEGSNRGSHAFVLVVEYLGRVNSGVYCTSYGVTSVLVSDTAGKLVSRWKDRGG